MPDTLTKDDRGDYRTDDGRWLAEKIDGGYRLWRQYRTSVAFAGEFEKISDVRAHLADLEAEQEGQTS